MGLATHCGASQRGALLALGTRAPTVLSLMLVNDALRYIDEARDCIEQGREPRQPLRAAMLRIRELPAALALPRGHTMTAGFTDLCEYTCRQLGAVRDETDFSKLTDTCDLLREICRAWVTLPCARARLSTGVGLAARQ
jgi:flagellin-specific chaperone FliS